MRSRRRPGITGRVLAPLGTIDFWFVADGRRIHKTVHHFLMMAQGGELSDEDVEVEQVEWVPLDELAERLAYDDERRLVEAGARTARRHRVKPRRSALRRYHAGPAHRVAKRRILLAVWLAGGLAVSSLGSASLPARGGNHHRRRTPIAGHPHRAAPDRAAAR